MLEYKFDTQLLIEGKPFRRNAIHDYIVANIPGDCLLVVGDETLIKIQFPHQRPLEGAGVRRLAGGHPRCGGRKYGAAGKRPPGLMPSR